MPFAFPHTAARRTRCLRGPPPPPREPAVKNKYIQGAGRAVGGGRTFAVFLTQTLSNVKITHSDSLTHIHIVMPPCVSPRCTFAHDRATDQTCRCTDDASPPETSRASAELRLLILANTRLRPPRLRFARLVLPSPMPPEMRSPASAMLPETRRSARAGVAPRLFARSTSDTCGQGRPSSRNARCGGELAVRERGRAPCGGARGSTILPGPCRVRRR